MDRICLPEETYERVRPFLKTLGITRIGRQTGLDHIGIPVWCAYTPNAKSIVVAQGKGLTDADARTSAVMEAIERAVACDPFLSIRNVSASALSDADERVDLLVPLLGRNQSPPRATDIMAFAAGEELFSSDRVYVPAEAVSLDRTLSNCRYWQSSDGLASGNTHGEAIFHGLLERVERDAHVLWQVLPQSSQHSRCLQPDAFSDEDVRSLIVKIEDAGILLRMFDMTSDIGIPCIGAFLAAKAALASRAPRYVDVTFGCGAHPSPERAAVRALTEAAQSRVTYISGARDDVFHETYRRPLPERLLRLFSADPSRGVPLPGPNDLGGILGNLKRSGITQAIAVRLSEPAFPFAVVKILVPGLESPEGERRHRFGGRAMTASFTS
ncbi:YcaO-like family protein [Neorhizobium galegae]|uniref:Methanogenesis marker protein 1 n=1 Tax=Neorhizobium galegae bv. orientalis str. HAMBI 540 TaxID=1028800 RepID=A0A068SZ77_NEOGA|nr:YcaO-like family protein [Neorhizobium galegae]MCQ1854434.1 YcaO-like family protein [Neorhizobium galegae]CDN51468.1 Methanogenesis marker protein 1 [Neorhizobium galegae bv. orientalis str. HAMBI 540]CDZ54101.1 Methanogenesis marker protein 1 [Neorhizobium galegae bv. orientalis]